MAATSRPSVLGAPKPLVHRMSSMICPVSAHIDIRLSSFTGIRPRTHLHDRSFPVHKDTRTDLDGQECISLIASMRSDIKKELKESLTVKPRGRTSSSGPLPKLSLMKLPKHSAQKSNLNHRVSQSDTNQCHWAISENRNQLLFGVPIRTSI